MIYGAEQEFYLASALFLRYTQTYLWNAQQSGIMGRGMEEHMEPIIKIEHLEKEFKLKEMDVHALRDVSLDIYKGDIYGIIGMSGAGKSTLVRCLNFLERPTAGTVTVNGKDLAKLSEKELREARKDIGMIFQHFNLLMQRSVIDNVCFPLEIAGMSRAQARKKAMEYLEIVGLAEKAKAYPVQLSGGQKQRVAIVRALIMKPEIMLFDEVTAALDPEMVREVLDVMLELAKSGSTMMIVTHEMQFARAVADKIVFLDGGEIVETGAPEEFFNRPKTERARRFLHTFTFDQVK